MLLAPIVKKLTMGTKKWDGWFGTERYPSQRFFFGEKDSVKNTTLNQVYLETESVVEGYCAESFRN